MLIELLPEPVAGVVAREVQFGAPEGEFRIGAEGDIRYVHPADNREWIAGANLAQFQSAAAAWNSYTSQVSRTPEPGQFTLVRDLRKELDQLGVTALPNSVWPALLEQAEHGML